MNAISDDQGSNTKLVPLSQSVPTAPGSYGYGGQYGVADESGIGVKIFEYWRILKKRKWLILSVVGACVAVGVVLTLMKTPLYTATVRLQIERNTAKIV